MEITTNNVPRAIIDAYELTLDERKKFDYLDWPAIDVGTDSASFFRYKGDIYDLGDFMRTEDNGTLAKAGWQGYSATSYSSAIVVRFSNDPEFIIVGFAYEA